MSHIATTAGFIKPGGVEVLLNKPQARNHRIKHLAWIALSSLDQKVIEFKNNGAVYRLQATKLGKLILTK